MKLVPEAEPTKKLPRSLPVTHGSLSDFSEDPVACLRELQRQHGELAALQEGDSRIVFVFGPQWNQRVLSDGETFHAWFFTVRGARDSAQRRLTSGLLSMNGAEHKQHRRMVMGPFQKRAIGGYHEAVLDLAADMLDDWRIGEVRDIGREMTQFMLRLTSGLLFGFGADVFDTAYSTGEKIDRWVELNHRTGLGAFVSNPKYVASYDELCALAGELERDIQGMIDRRRSSGRPGTDVLSLLIAAHGRDGGISDQELIGHVALLFGAAHLTTAHTFTWTLFLLAQHSHVMRELDDEIRATVAGDCPTLDEIARMPVLDRVLKESMRVLPASGCSHRVTAKPTTLGPLELPKGAPVIFSQYVTHHLPSLYPGPESFDPNRWLRISPSAYEYLPFGAGPRMCIGGPLAMMILKAVLPTILKQYRLSVVPGSEINGNIVSTMLGPTTPVPMTIHPADGRFESAPVTGNVHQMVDLSGDDASQAFGVRRAA